MTFKSKDEQDHQQRMLLYQFLLTFVVGGLLTYYFQNLQNDQKIEADKRAEEVRVMDQRREQATAVFNEISPLMDTRLNNWRRLAWALEDRVGEDTLKTRYAEYEEVFFRWNRSLNKNRALICQFFGPQLGDIFESVIMPEFINLHQTIYGFYKMPRAQRPLIKTDGLNSLADSINNTIYSFNNAIAEKIRSGNVGLTNPGQECDFHPRNQ